MKRLTAVIFSLLIVLACASARADSFDATGGFSCDITVASQWSFEAYRAGDGEYLSMINGHAPLTELTKYGMEALYLPDGDQPYYPFFAKFDDKLYGSPATKGSRFDATATWTSTMDTDVTIRGFADVVGDLKGDHGGRKVRATLLKGDDVLWSEVVTGGTKATFSVKTKLAKGDKVRMRLENPDDEEGKLTMIDFTVETD